MAKSIVEQTPVEKQAHATLSRYATPVLLKKLEAGAMAGASKTAAIAILEKRGEDVAKYKGETWVKPGSAAAPKVLSKKEVEEQKTEKVEKKAEPKAAKEPKLPKEKKERKAKEEVVSIDPADSKVAKILASEDSKTEKIKSLLGLGYTVNQISKLTILAAHYSFCHTIQKNLANAK